MHHANCVMKQNSEHPEGQLVLYGWGLLDELSHDDQARLIRDILEVVLMEDAQ
jgi:hypothetical protein